MEPRETHGSNGQGHGSDAEESAESARVLQHDIRTPLTVISGHVQLLQRRLRRGDGLDLDVLLRSLGYIHLAAKAMEDRLSELDQHKGKPDVK